MRTVFCLALIPLAAACSRPSTLASFEGAITMHTTTAGGEPHDMVVQTKADKLRFDIVGPGGPTHAVYDPSQSKVEFFVDTEKKWMDLDVYLPNSSITPTTDPASSAITKSGTHKKVAGYDCEQVSVADASGKRSEVCIAQGITFFDVNGLRPGLQKAESDLAKEFRLHKSFPLESIDYAADGKEVSRMEVTRIEKQKLDDAIFAVPADYTKVDLPKHPH